MALVDAEIEGLDHLMPAGSITIANEFIRRALAEGQPLDQMQIQKLVYIAHGWNLAINGLPLTSENPQICEYGPIYPEISAALATYGRRPIKRQIRIGYGIVRALSPSTPEEDPEITKLSAEEQNVVDRVYRDYSRYPAYQLSALTHHDKTPWREMTRHGEALGTEIYPELIRRQFIALSCDAAAEG